MTQAHWIRSENQIEQLLSLFPPSEVALLEVPGLCAPPAPGNSSVQKWGVWVQGPMAACKPSAPCGLSLLPWKRFLLFRARQLGTTGAAPAPGPQAPRWGRAKARTGHGPAGGPGSAGRMAGQGRAVVPRGCSSGIRASAGKQLPQARVGHGLASPEGWGPPSAAPTLSWPWALKPGLLPLQPLQNLIVLLLV